MGKFFYLSVQIAIPAGSGEIFMYVKDLAQIFKTHFVEFCYGTK